MCASSFENNDAIMNWCPENNYLMCLKLAKMVSKGQPRFMIGGFSGSDSLPDGFIH